MPKIHRGEVWLVDLGMVAKVRPALVLSVAFTGQERAPYAVIPHATALRGGRFEVSLSVPWLKPGAFDLQGMRSLPGSVFLRRLGLLPGGELESVMGAAKTWLGIP